MIHLKLFEAIDWVNDKPELERFCKENLAYLIDEGFNVEVHKLFNHLKPFKKYNTGSILITKILKDKEHINGYPITFNWIDVKNDFIPFLEMLIMKYGLKQDKKTLTIKLFSGFMRTEKSRIVDVEKVLNDKLISRIDINKIIVEWQ